MTDIVYFELNNWSPGRDYPNAEPFVSWLADDLNQAFRDENWIKENKLVVVDSLVDMSSNYCVSAKKDWVESHCPELFTEYTQFIRTTDEDEDVPYGRFGCPFLEYTEENIGLHIADEKCVNGYWEYIIDDE